MLIFMLKNKICFTSIDIEHDRGIGQRQFRGVEALVKILDIFKKHKVQATLFITGETLARYCASPDLSQTINYEIACHSYTHRFWDTLNKEEREKELADFIELYQGIFGQRPLGFRAPSHIIDEAGLKLLEEMGFLYDASVVPHYPPFKKYRGYKGRAPLVSYHPNGQRILEIPNAGQILGIPLAAAWIAKLPVWLYKVMFIFYKPNFITLAMHSWDALNPKYLKKLEQILQILEKEGYQFQNGKQIFESRK